MRATELTAQLREVDRRFGLATRATPFTRCLLCNGTLHPVDKADVIDELPPAVARNQERFVRCADCGRVYWPGSHYARMRAEVDRLLR